MKKPSETIRERAKEIHEKVFKKPVGAGCTTHVEQRVEAILEYLDEQALKNDL